MSGDDPLAPPDAALARAVAEPDGDRLLTLEELAEQEELSLPLLEALAREGFLLPAAAGPERFTPGTADVVRAGLSLVEAGLPLAELLDIARRTDQAMRSIAEHAVDVFVQFVRDPVRGTADDDDTAAEQLLGAFETMVPATERLVGAHFRSLLLAAARERIAEETA